MKPRNLLQLAALCALPILHPQAHAAAPQYSVTVLAFPPGATSSTGTGINAAGQVVGYYLGVGISAERWTGTTPTALGNVTDFNFPYAINAAGQVAGAAQGALFPASAVRWTGTTAQVLSTLGGSTGHGTAINASGQVAGYSDTTGNTAVHAALWTGTTPANLVTLGGTNSYGEGVNDLGQVAGYSQLTGDAVQHAVLWTGTSPADLGTLHGGGNSLGYSVNATGQVAGQSQLGGTAYHAALWTGANAADLGTLGGTNSYGYGINDAGDVTGMSYLAGDGVQDAFLYTGGTMYDLASLLVPGSGVTNLTLSSVGNSINDLGQISVTGTVAGHNRALRLDPVVAPEPASAALLLLGGGALLGWRRRR